MAKDSRNCSLHHTVFKHGLPILKKAEASVDPTRGKDLTCEFEMRSVLTQRILSIEFREFDPSDYRRLADIYDAIFPERSRTIEEWRFYDDSLDTSKYYFKRYAGLNAATGEVIGF